MNARDLKKKILCGSLLKRFDFFQIWHNTLDTILICAPSNAAADVIAKRLLKYIPAISVDRIYSRSRDRYFSEDYIHIRFGMKISKDLIFYSVL